MKLRRFLSVVAILALLMTPIGLSADSPESPSWQPTEHLAGHNR